MEVEVELENLALSIGDGEHGQSNGEETTTQTADHLNAKDLPELTENAISRMLNGTINQNIVAQVLHSEELMPKSYKERMCYCLALSDGTFAYPLCLVQARTIGPVERFTILKIMNYTINELEDRRVIFLINAQVLLPGKAIGKTLGDPGPFIEEGAPPLGSCKALNQTEILQIEDVITMKGKSDFYKGCKSCREELIERQNGSYSCERCKKEDIEIEYLLTLSFCVRNPPDQIWVQTTHQESLKFLDPGVDLDELYKLYKSDGGKFESEILHKMFLYNKSRASGRLPNVKVFFKEPVLKTA